MAEEELKHEHHKQDLPLVLLLGLDPCSVEKFFPELFNKFRFLSPYEFPAISINQFLKTNARSIKVLLCEGGGEATIPINSDILNCLPSLECIVSASAGVNHIDLTESKRRGIVVTNAGTVFSEDVADCAVALLLDVLRRISASDRYVRSRLWPSKGEYLLEVEIFQNHEENDQQQRPLILVLGQAPQKFLQVFFPKLLQNFRLLRPSDYPTVPILEFLKTHAQSIETLLCIGPPPPVTSDMIQSLSSLKCIMSTSAGVNHIDLTECKCKGISVTNAGNVFSEDVADYAVGLLVDVLRKVSASDRYVKSRLWPLKREYQLGSKVGGKRIGIIGLGSIGSEVAKRLQAFGCSIAYNSRKKKESVSFPYFPNVTNLAANSDALILCCALTNETYHIINKDVLSALGKEGVVINIGRGALVDEKELVHCLVQGEIGGAGLDVFENEPNVPKELFELDNVVMTPHSAVLTPESFSALHELTIANLEAFFSNKPLLSPVNYE
ncbi:hypothetical protein AQUCO_03500252v1 [Aquilegia coerulea]|uniref:Uncharacterized protein n=1 Tax=Aquilegia coerulea TaxID=218851 RepID=A0A2G5CWZ9_AQUCA|nr:hypothetical protein AQUCO_03500252v1 [Aquilegia coerulea]